MKKTFHTHCQICERAICANTGVIAHHGYTRPYRMSGYQTASCLGARHLPYEQSADVIPVVIKMIEETIRHNQDAIKRFLTDPPRGIETRTRDRGAYGRSDEVRRWSVLRPAGFDPKDINSYHLEGTYEKLWANHQRDCAAQVRAATEELHRLQKRLADWKPAAVEGVTS